jgi:hypothetical protein
MVDFKSLESDGERIQKNAKLLSTFEGAGYAIDSWLMDIGDDFPNVDAPALELILLSDGEFSIQNGSLIYENELQRSVWDGDYWEELDS